MSIINKFMSTSLVLMLAGFSTSTLADTAQDELAVQQARANACVDKDDGDVCSYTLPNGGSEEGFCKRTTPDQLKPICQPTATQ